MTKKPKELDCVLLDDGTNAVVLETYSDGHLLLEKEIPSSGTYPDYEQFDSDVTHVARITFNANK